MLEILVIPLATLVKSAVFTVLIPAIELDSFATPLESPLRPLVFTLIREFDSLVRLFTSLSNALFARVACAFIAISKLSTSAILPPTFHKLKKAAWKSTPL